MSSHESASIEVQLERVRNQRAALAEFGLFALHTDDLDGLLTRATEIVSEATEVPLVKILELLPDQDTMLVRAGVHWNPGVVGKVRFPAHTGSPAGYALREGKPVISPGPRTCWAPRRARPRTCRPSWCRSCTRTA